VFGDVIVRVRGDFALDMHVDTDEANAAALNNDSVASFDGVQ
jgi:propanediol utilization protein